MGFGFSAEMSAWIFVAAGIFGGCRMCAECEVNREKVRFETLCKHICVSLWRNAFLGCQKVFELSAASEEERVTV